MEIKICGEPKEIAALVLAVQERRNRETLILKNPKSTEGSREELVEAIWQCLGHCAEERSQMQQPDSKERTPHQDEVPGPPELDRQ